MDKLSRCSSSWKARSTARRTSRASTVLNSKTVDRDNTALKMQKYGFLRGGGNHRNLPLSMNSRGLLFFVKVLVSSR